MLIFMMTFRVLFQLREEIYRELELVGLEPHELPRALNFLAANQAKARTLFSCPLQIRMGVLKDMMGARD